MGEPIRWSISVDEETEQIGDSLQAEFAPIVGDNRSRLVQMIFKSWHRLGFTMETLATALSQAQRIKLANAAQSLAELNNSSQIAFPSAVESPETLLGKKPLVRVGPSKTGSHQRREFAYVSPKDDVEVVEAWVPHFPGKVSPINSTLYARVA